VTYPSVVAFADCFVCIFCFHCAVLPYLSISSKVASGWYLNPPLKGPLLLLCCTRCASTGHSIAHHTTGPKMGVAAWCSQVEWCSVSVPRRAENMYQCSCQGCVDCATCTAAPRCCYFSCTVLQRLYAAER
jgi:hypothetical protein